MLWKRILVEEFIALRKVLERTEIHGGTLVIEGFKRDRYKKLSEPVCIGPKTEPTQPFSIRATTRPKS